MNQIRCLSLSVYARVSNIHTRNTLHIFTTTHAYARCQWSQAPTGLHVTGDRDVIDPKLFFYLPFYLFTFLFISYSFIYVCIYWRNWLIDCLHIFHFEQDVASLLVALAAEICETREFRGCCNAVSPWLTPSSLHHDTVIAGPHESRSWL